MTLSFSRRALALAALVLPLAAYAQDKSITVASTTSTEQSGLFVHLLPAFKKDSGIDVRVVAVGTGQALDMGRRGDADAVFVHDQAAEEKFVAEGFGVKRFPVMYNDFVLIGPKTDPAGLKGSDISVALTKLGASQQGFISRGDKSGTHAAELRYWKAASIDVASAKPAGYKECGCGMGPALNLAAQSDAYVLSDRGTWLAFKNRADLALLVQGDRRLFNQYGVMVVSPEKHAHVKRELAQAFVDWLVSAKGQTTIAAYKIEGEQLFFSEREAMRRRQALQAALLTVPPIAQAQGDVLTVYAAGSLRAALTRVGQDFEASTGGAKVNFLFGASGLLRDRLQNGERADVFASANMEHPRALADSGKAGKEQTFARNALCALAAPSFELRGKTLAQRLLDTDVRVGTSTPKADPSGDYAFEMFERIEKAGAAPLGAAERLKAKALQLTGGPNSPPPPVDRNVYGALVGSGQADVFITYCTNAAVARQEAPALQTLAVPEAINVYASYGLALLQPASPLSRRFVDFVLSAAGQRRLAELGFLPP